MTVQRMFPFITCTWNPLGGECRHLCEYCWARKLIERNKFAKYQGRPRLVEKEMERQFKFGDFVFVCDMCDLFGEWVPGQLIEQILAVTNSFRKTKFLFLTKNPDRYYCLMRPGVVWKNVILGSTIESNRSYSKLSHAPDQRERLSRMYQQFRLDRGLKRFISIEPILDFDLEFIPEIVKIQPWAVAVGYDNYGHHLPEPSLEKTLDLIRQLEANHITVYRKTLRECWKA